MVGLITFLICVTELSRLMVLDSSNQMTSLAGSGFKGEEDHLNIKILTALLFIMSAHYLVTWKYVSQSNKLEIHPIGMAALKNTLFLIFVSLWLIKLKESNLELTGKLYLNQSLLHYG